MCSYMDVVVRPESVHFAKHGLLTTIFYHDSRKSVAGLDFVYIDQGIFVLRRWNTKIRIRVPPLEATSLIRLYMRICK